MSGLWQHADAGGQQVGATQVASTATIAISLLFTFSQLLRGVHTRLIQVPVMAKMRRVLPLLILAIVRSHRPTELKRQHDHQEDGNPAAHDSEYIGWKVNTLEPVSVK
ncbi:hypothetical protein [Aquabacterium sp.]|uniref:hypothetical protein n=1 Tax=Aquabacterium sp. TaxID=1872578 RepID=UPI004037B182